MHHCMLACTISQSQSFNVWSHGLGALCFLLTGVLASKGVLPGGRALLLYGASVAVLFTASSLTHVYPGKKRVVCMHALWKPIKEFCLSTFVPWLG